MESDWTFLTIGGEDLIILFVCSIILVDGINNESHLVDRDLPLRAGSFPDHNPNKFELFNRKSFKADSLVLVELLHGLKGEDVWQILFMESCPAKHTSNTCD